MSVASHLRVQLQGIGGALRFALLPVVCAAVVALASESSRGRQYAAVLAIASLLIGVAFHAREILRGRPARGSAPSQAPMSEGDWMLRLR